MEELETNENLNINSSSEETSVDNDSEVEKVESPIENLESPESTNSTDIVEYKEVEEPCVSLTIIGENKLTNAEVFIRRGFKYSIRAFFSAIVLTIVKMFM